MYAHFLAPDLHSKVWEYFSRSMTKPRKWHVRPAKTQICLRSRAVWSESWLCALGISKDLRLLHADWEDWSDWVDAQADLSSLDAWVILLVLSYCGSFPTRQIVKEKLVFARDIITQFMGLSYVLRNYISWSFITADTIEIRVNTEGRNMLAWAFSFFILQDIKIIFIL